MTRYDTSLIVTVAEMREAEAQAGRDGVTADLLVARAGEGTAAWLRRLAAGAETLILCGPGNNGADGYAAAVVMKAAGLPVRVAASAPPRTTEALAAAKRWDGPVETLAEANEAPILVDALFGIGLSRPIESATRDRLDHLLTAARLTVAIDLPSGLDADTARVDGHSLPGRGVDVTLALGALKPAHVLWPGAAMCGEVRTVDIGLTHALRMTPRSLSLGGRLAIPSAGGADHKYSRGMVAVVSGAMPGAARLAATAAMRAGAGYVEILGDAGGGPDALVHRPLDEQALGDKRLNAVIVGPGLGRDAAAKERLDLILRHSTCPIVIDGDALHLMDVETIAALTRSVVLTPHDGEFRALFTNVAEQPDRIAETHEALGDHRFTLVRKGASTIVASRGTTTLFPPANPWLSTAGTGDVLTGAIGALLARTGDAHRGACGGVWLHAEAARRCGASFIADDLAHALTAARAAS